MTRKSAIQSKYEAQQAGQSTKRCAKAYSYTIYVVCLEAPEAHPDWKDKEWLRECGGSALISHNQGCWPDKEHILQTWLANRAKEIAAAVQRQEGGVWVGRIRDATNDPVPDRPITRAEIAGIEAHILNGPDGPAWQYVAWRKEQQAKRQAGREPLIPTAQIASRVRGVPAETPKERAQREQAERFRPREPGEEADDSGPAVADFDSAEMQG